MKWSFKAIELKTRATGWLLSNAKSHITVVKNHITPVVDSHVEFGLIDYSVTSPEIL